jgi:hypothetical protein
MATTQSVVDGSKLSITTTKKNENETKGKNEHTAEHVRLRAGCCRMEAIPHTHSLAHSPSYCGMV